MKKIIAAVIAIIMLAGMIPTTVFAAPPSPGPPLSERPWQQHPVTDSTIVVDPDSGGTSYRLNIMWSRPPLSRVATGNFPEARLPDVPLGLWHIFPTDYRVSFGNATTGNMAPPTLPTITVPAPANGQDRTLPAGTRFEVGTGAQSFTMSPASLYEIRIHPVRNVPVETIPPVPGGTPGIAAVEAPVANAPGFPVGRDLLFLTDIEPSAQGLAGSIAVTWANPTFGATTVFPYWEVSYRIYESGSPPGAWVPRPPMSIGPGDGQITANADGTLTAVIVDPRLRTIGSYQVRVEPLLGPNPANQNHRVRQGQDFARIDSVPGRNFDLYFTQNDYTDIATMVPSLQLDQTGVEFIRLSWSPLTAIRDRITHLVIEEWPADDGWEGRVPVFGEEAWRIREITTLTGFQVNNTDHFIGPGIPRERRGFSLAIHLENPNEVIRTPIVIFDPLRAEFDPYSPEIVELFHAGSGRISMEWLAFARFPTVPAEAENIPAGNPYRGRFVDTSMYYEVFVTSSWAELQALTAPVRAGAVEPLMTIHLPGPEVMGMRRPSPLMNSPTPPIPAVYDPTWLLSPNHFITQYQAMADGAVAVRDIAGNRVYFVAIRAIREPDGQDSRWAYGSVYIPPLRPLEITPEMISSPPVHVVREGVNEIDLAWDIRYLEIMRPQTSPQQIPTNPPGGFTAPPERNVWYTVVGVDRDARDNNLIFGRSAAHINYVLNEEGELEVPLGSPSRHRFLNEIIRESSLRNRLLGLQDPVLRLNINDPRQVGAFLGEAEEEVIGFLASEWSLPLPANPPITLRIQDTTVPGTSGPVPFSYEIYAVPYATVRQFPGGFDAFRTQLMNSNARWTSIGQPDVENGVAGFTVTGLAENTPYIIFMRPYVTIGGRQIRAAYPTFVVGTTVITRPPVIPDPTTPVLIEVPRYTRRDRLGVKWRVQADMIYNIHLSHFFTDYPQGGRASGGTVIPLSYEDIQAALDGETVTLEDPRAVLNVQMVDGTRYFHLRVYERFPGTVYHIWAYAMGVDSEGNVATNPSHPSNPVDIRTLDIEPPPPPRSFSRAPQNLLTIFNRYNDTEYEADEPYAMTLSWMRIIADLRDDDGELRPRAEAGTGDGSIRPLNLPNVGATDAYAALHLLRFEELRANQRFYARARTILTVQRGGDDLYSYEIHFADNDDFLDAVTFIIPPAPELDPINMRRAYSDWVYIDVDTGVSPDEFDGVQRPDQYPLPERDWEITYDRSSQTLTWRFRTNQRGADGRLDQNVDQRFISRLIQSRVFTYTIDLSEYGVMPIANRQIIIPESILRAFDERQITLEILAGEHNVTIPPGAFNTAQTRGLQPGIGSYYTIGINSQMSGMPPLATNTEFSTIPQRFGVALETPQRSANLTSFARPVGVELPAADFITPDGLRTGLFVLDTNTASWRDTQGQFNFAAESLNSTIQAPTTFAGISRQAPPVAEPHNRANDAMNRVSSRLTITDMTQFDPAREITANEFNNLVSAVAQGNTTVTMNAAMTAANRQSMTNARLLAQPEFTRQNALDILVRLYENRTRQILTPMTPAESVPGMQGASPALTRNLRIAADLGFITGPLEPTGRVTMGEVMHMLDIIIQDAR
ncbi:MAG: hypothetical protein FWC70_03535 [Defluviitaleaceae bacterium]|nr:hypothetical protein [Defluviitaleaceae bacterium]